MRLPLDSRTKAERASLDLLSHNLNLIASNLSRDLGEVKGEMRGIRQDFAKALLEERQERRREGLSAKLWVSTLVTMATILSNLIFKFFT